MGLSIPPALPRPGEGACRPLAVDSMYEVALAKTTAGQILPAEQASESAPVTPNYDRFTLRQRSAGHAMQGRNNSRAVPQPCGCCVRASSMRAVAARLWQRAGVAGWPCSLTIPCLRCLRTNHSLSASLRMLVTSSENINMAET
eukprot:6202949-Pleurochrysis_carterae.AAC.1